MTDSGPEPTGWELMRGLRDLKDEISKIGGRVVPLEVYNADKQGIADRFTRLESRQRDSETAAAEEKQSAEAARRETEKMKRQNQFVIAMAVGSAVLSVIGGLVLKGIPL